MEGLGKSKWGRWGVSCWVCGTDWRESYISSGWIGMVGSGIGLSTKALNKALHKGKACIRALKPWIRALKPWIMHLFSQASLPGIQALKKGKSLEKGIALK